MTVEYSERAAAELEEIADYFRSVGAIGAGEKTIRTICSTIDSLNGMPFIGRRQTIPGVRKLVIPESHTTWSIRLA